ncbi:DUF2393 family protein [Helicobacter fennelliae]|uniref:DUF2393 family protein n=1 Tax=Helicobacter fennelliae TaxID=215 RepID=UPI001B330996|nr:DUF2393 family protein [Helicobacter fennelliae]
MQALIGFKTLFFDALTHITITELSVFTLFFLVFMLFAFISLIFWHYRVVFTLFVVLDFGILLCMPFGMEVVIKKFIFPLQIHSERFNPLTYTTGLSFDIVFQNKSKLKITECVLSAIVLHDEKSFVDKMKNKILPLNAYITTLHHELKPNETYKWQGIIDGYNAPNHDYKINFGCH